MFYNIIRSSKIQLIFFLLIGCVLSICLKYEVMWDFANYHYYNPWAFLNGRVGYDIAPAGLNTYFNPLMDIPLYLMIQYFNDSPNIIYAFQGLYFGGLLYVFFKILGLFFDGSTWTGRASILAAMLIGSTGWATFMQIGTSTNEEAMALLVLLSFYLLLKEIFVSKSGRWQVYFGSGFILGSAMGLKLTVVIYCISTGLSLILFYKEIVKNKRNIPLFILGGILGFLLFNGFWMYMMWDKFQNPFFPFLNNIFQSEYLPNENFRDKKMLPENIWEYIFYPFYVAFFQRRTEGNALILDYRLLFIYVMSVVYCISLFWKREKIRTYNRIFLFTGLWLFISYVLWLTMFTITRYYIILELFVAMFIVKFFVEFLPQARIAKILFISIGIVVFYSLVMTPFFSDTWEQRKDDYQLKQTLLYDLTKKKPTQGEYKSLSSYKRFVDIEDINIPDNTLIKLYNLPSSFVLPFWGQNKNIRGVLVKQQAYTWNKDQDLFSMPSWQNLIQNALASHNGPEIAVIAETEIFKYNLHTERLNEFKNMYCRKLFNNMYNLSICVPNESKEQFFPQGSNDK